LPHRFKSIDSATPMFLPPDLRDWVVKDDRVHFVISAIDRFLLAALSQKDFESMGVFQTRSSRRRDMMLDPEARP